MLIQPIAKRTVHWAASVWPDMIRIVSKVVRWGFGSALRTGLIIMCLVLLPLLVKMMTGEGLMLMLVLRCM